jgi:hypothetical protein
MNINDTETPANETLARPLKLGIAASFATLAIVIGLISGLGMTGCTVLQKAPPKIEGPRVSVMAFNVENLFDTEHDEGTEDFTYLPLEKKKDEKINAGCNANSSAYRKQECLDTDWNAEVLTKKMRRVADVIQQVGDGKGPDILILSEVENQKVVDLLNQNHLKNQAMSQPK